jgi:hypothetical protein
MNKRGFLLAEETLKILVAVICILFLAFFLFSLYNSKVGAEKVKEAKENLNRIGEIIFSLSEGQTENQDIPNPKGWNLYSFIGEEKPNSCLGENCLCICATAKKCDKKGSCIIVSNLASPNLDIEIGGADDLTFINIKKQNGNILIGEN